ncbi:(S)-ureidoglycine aminohydrolase [Aggregatilineales bacterium SYSU G02658]
MRSSIVGHTRTSVQQNHAFIAPDGHVWGALPGWGGVNTQGVILISPQMRGKPRFLQYLVMMGADGVGAPPTEGVQRFVYVLEGQIVVKLSSERHTIPASHFVYLPPNTSHELRSEAETARLLVFEKPYVPFHSAPEDRPMVHVGDAWAGEGEPFMGDEAARLRVLLPTDLAYDMAINLFTFRPGAALPFVETHIMEHGLYLLEGQGVYRLDESWYPIQAGDTIWMGPYCPQWFCAIGKTPSTYIYYKDVNRDPLAE